jgi:putative thioredoxin
MNAATAASHDVTDFQAQVLDRSHDVPVVVDFWAPWCGPCRVLGPTLDKLATTAGGRWALAKVNTEEMPDIAGAYGVMSIPNVKLFRNGQVVDEFVGALPEREIRRWLDLLVPVAASPLVTEAEALAARGDLEGAAKALASLLAGDPGNAPARFALAELQLRTDPAAVEATVAPLGDEAIDHAEALRVLARLVAHADAWPDGAGRAPFEAALAAVKRGDWDAALGAVVGSLQAQRRWADGAARDLGRAIFIHLGITHPVCEKHYRGFASAINV